jgi:hypothetical protein
VSAQLAEQLTRMLTDLADDPDAPASTVTAMSVIEAARAAAADAPPPASVGDLHLLAVRAEAARTKAAKRRTMLFSLAAAAAVAAVAAVVIPLAVSSNSTTTSANSAKYATPAAAAAQPAPGASAESPAAAGDSAAGAAPAPETGGDAAAPELGTGSVQERPPPGDRAVTSVVPTGTPDTPQLTDTAGQSCWPPLPGAAISALTATLPAGAFQAPAALAAACGPDPVAGAALTGTAPGTSLEVMVSKADSGRCARGDGEAGVRCVLRGDGVYVAEAGGGSATAYVYGNGNEVTVGAASISGPAAATTGLTDDQTVAAAQAVLGALG